MRTVDRARASECSSTDCKWSGLCSRSNPSLLRKCGKDDLVSSITKLYLYNKILEASWLISSQTFSTHEREHLVWHNHVSEMLHILRVHVFNILWIWWARWKHDGKEKLWVCVKMRSLYKTSVKICWQLKLLTRSKCTRCIMHTGHLYVLDVQNFYFQKLLQTPWITRNNYCIYLKNWYFTKN